MISWVQLPLVVELDSVTIVLLLTGGERSANFSQIGCRRYYVNESASRDLV